MADAFHPEHAERLEDPARLAALPQAAIVELLRLRGDETVVNYGAGTGATKLIFRYSLGDSGIRFYWPHAGGAVGPTAPMFLRRLTQISTD